MKKLVVIGGGFGGLAAARYLAHHRDQVAVTLIDRKPTSDFLPLLPDVVGGRLPPAAVSVSLRAMARRLGFAFSHDAVQSIDPDRRLVIGQGQSYPYEALIIAAGSEPNFYGNRAAQDRIRVDECLRAREDIFAVGDAAAFLVGDRPLRMSVQFAIAQGAWAAANALRSLRGAPLRPFRPRDPGFVLPLAHGRSCGTVFGVRLRGRLPTFLHYGLCVYRLPALASKIKICKLLPALTGLGINLPKEG